MLTDDVQDRPIPRKVLKHAWFQTWVPPAEDSLVQREHLDRLRSFRKLNRLKRAALTVVSTMLDDRELETYHKLFTALDTNGDGFLTVEELRLQLKEMRRKDVDLEGVFREGQSSKKTKAFSYTEFVT